MERNTLEELYLRLRALTVFRNLKEDAVIQALSDYLDWVIHDNALMQVEQYAAFVNVLFESDSGHLGKHIENICCDCENVYVKQIGCGKVPNEHIQEALANELETLQMIADLTKDDLTKDIDWNGYLPSFPSGNVDIASAFTNRAKNIGKYGYGAYAKNRMFYLDENSVIVPVKHPDGTSLSMLVDYEAERQIVIDNTRALLAGKPAANILLTGDAGTGKSSTVKAVVNELYEQGLRIIEVRKDQLCAIPRILDELASNPLKFILFIDDLSFLKDDDNYNALKAVLEGSVSAKSQNVVIYATSNRRHIIKEKFSDREGDDVHRNETLQELVSLSERFGIHITFGKPTKQTYLHIVKHLATESGIQMDEKELELLAERFALARGGRSARLARQFVDGLISAKNE